MIASGKTSDVFHARALRVRRPGRAAEREKAAAAELTGRVRVRAILERWARMRCASIESRRRRPYTARYACQNDHRQHQSSIRQTHTRKRHFSSAYEINFRCAAKEKRIFLFSIRIFGPTACEGCRDAFMPAEFSITTCVSFVSCAMRRARTSCKYAIRRAATAVRLAILRARIGDDDRMQWQNGERRLTAF